MELQRLLSAITEAQGHMVRDVTSPDLFQGLLAALLELTQSEYGFVGEVIQRDGKPCLKTHALTNIAWDAETRRFYAENAPQGLVFSNLDTLFGAALRTGEVVIANDPASDPRRGGLPPGHPPLRAFLGLPLFSGGAFLGLAGVANRPGGYDQELVESVSAFTQTCANAVYAVRSELARVAAERSLQEERARLRAVLDGALDAIITIDERGRIVSANPATERMLGYTVEELLDRNVSLLMPEPYRSEHDGYIASYLKTGSPKIIGSRRETLARRKSGVEVPVDLALSEIRAGDRRLFTGILRDLSEREAVSEQVRRLTAELDRTRYAQFIGQSPVMQRLYETIDEVARGDWTALIVGETGTGKELVARAIHAASARRDGPFVAVNCAGLPDALLASQLFGHRRGAFTGAFSDQQGLFEAANGGTLFLDEVGDVSPTLQVSLLRVLQEGEIVPVGETRPRRVDVRVLAATHRDLEGAVALGSFRADLLYRIRVARVGVPPLRDRGDDLLLLAEAFLAHARVAAGKAVSGFSHEALRLLQRHPWPGNVRELRSAVEHAVIAARGPQIRPEHLPPEVSGQAPSVAPAARPADARPRGAGPRPDTGPTAVLSALQEAGGNRARAARLLGISRATLYRRLKELGLDGDREV